MKKHSDEIPDWEAQRNKIIGLGETSIRKSYYPELQQRIQELEKKNRELEEAYAEQTARLAGRERCCAGARSGSGT